MKPLEMKFSNIFELMGQEFPKKKIPFLLIGGFALHFYGINRQTFNVDFMIHDKQFEAVKTILEQEYYCEYKDSLFYRFQPKINKENLSLNFLFVDKKTLRGLLEKGKKVILSNQEVVVPHLLHLIALKIHAIQQNSKREYKDLLDIMELMRKNKLAPDHKEVRALFEKYGKPALFKKVLLLWEK